MFQFQRPEVKQYWEKVADDFDSIYSGQKSPFMRFLDRVLRQAMCQRYDLTLEECKDSTIESILDIGSGPGRFCCALAPEKERVIGIDFSRPMIELAKQHAKELGVEDKCEFLVGDFLETDLSGPFDAVLAMGLFDYIKEPKVFLDKMSSLLSGKLISTWPTIYSWRMPVRWVRLNLKRCPVYFFTPNQIEQLHQKAGLEIQRFERIREIYFVVAHKQGKEDA
ncbi:MAG: class I SAM-dependent methyltransferase [Prochloraceae cyanobacterium]|nr:class I SAM-dependent methyltransferase [Prochloraceae cyanobacterium]